MTTRAFVMALAVLVLSYAPARADVVQITNGDRITGTVSEMSRGTLSFDTDAAGMLSIDWSEVVMLTSTQNIEVELANGQRFLGTLDSPSPGRLVVTTASGPTPPLDMKEIVRLTSVAEGFMGRISGSVDFGLSYTQASDAQNYALNGSAAYVGASYEADVTGVSLLSKLEDETVTRNDLKVDVRRRLPDRWYALGLGEVQQDDELDLNLRLLLGGGVGRVLRQSNQARLAVEGGLDYDVEWYESQDGSDQSLEAFGGVDWDWFGNSATTILTRAVAFVSLERERLRLELDADVRRDVVGELYTSFNVFESFDSDPPGDRPRNNLGVAIALGWTF